MLGLSPRIKSIGLFTLALCVSIAISTPMSRDVSLMASQGDSRKRFYLTRTDRNAKCTHGVLILPATSLAKSGLRLQTLEPPRRPGKPRSIPAGTYVVEVLRSSVHPEPRLLLHAVEGFSNVYIEVGNFPQNTRGCVLVGLEREGDTLQESKLAYQKLLESLGNASEFILVISDEQPSSTQLGSPALSGGLPPLRFPPIR